MKEIVEIVARALVDAPEQVDVSTMSIGHVLILKLQVGQGDAGKIIGKQGRTINAIRTILNSVAAKMKQNIILEIVDGKGHSARFKQARPHTYPEPDRIFSRQGRSHLSAGDNGTTPGNFAK